MSAKVFISTTIVLFATRTALSQESFTLVALPDTQNYTVNSSYSHLFTQQTQWIADQIQVGGNPRNIQFVSHLGDLVSDGSSLAEWERANASMSVLDGVVKYSVLPGNHDYDVSSVKGSGLANYVSYFGPQRFESELWYGGADPSGSNSYQRFAAGGYEFIHLALEFEATVNQPFRDDSPLEWAQSIIDANPHLPVILSTHDYIQDSPGGRSESGEALWNEFVRKNDQVFLVLNGHYHTFGGTFGGEYHQVSFNDFGRPVVEVLQNFQHYPNGGDGWLRLIEFDFLDSILSFETYSPVLDQFQLEEVDVYGPYASQFGLPIAFSTRLVPIESPNLLGDFDDDGDVDGRDFLHWQRGNSPIPMSEGDLGVWRSNYGTAGFYRAAQLSVPEPSHALAYFATCAILARCVGWPPTRKVQT